MSREVCTAKRDVTTTPLQSLVLLNDPQFVEAARHLAETVMKQSPSDGAARTRTAFRALIGRLPDDTETTILSGLFIEQRALFAARPDDALKLVAVGESRMSPDVQPVDLAAMTTVVSAIMNFDEFVMMK
jgi:hypothetical protein